MNRLSKTLRVLLTTPGAALLALALVATTANSASNQAATKHAAPSRTATAARTTTPVPALIPAPAQLVMQRGAFAFDARTRLHADGEQARHAASLLATLTSRSHGLDLRVAPRARGDATGIVFALDPTMPATSDEAYRLDVTPSHVRIRARDARGLQHGAVTLWQLMVDADGPRRSIPALRVDDAPRFAWRGLMLDVSRHFRTVDEVKQVIDAMVVHKLNVFHWHLTDDQGWRVEITRYPRLTTVGGCRRLTGDTGTHADGRPVRECAWYTQDQIREVVRYAAERHIEVVPEIDVPGHATAMIAAYPELGVVDTPLVPTPEWGVFTNLLDPDDRTLAVLDEIYGELASLFPGRYVHIGGDEAVKNQWIASPRVQAQKRALGLDTEMQLQSRMVAHIEKTLAAHGKRLIGWDEILEGTLPASATVMSWRGTEGGLEAARAGHDVVMSPVSHLYLDYHQTTSPNEPSGRPTTVDLRKLYGFEPVPAELAADRRHHILGLQANVWTEHMRTFGMVQHAMFPRVAALAEVGWSPADARDYDRFVARLPAQLRRYRMLDIGVAATPFEVRIDGEADGDDHVTVRLSNALDLETLHYTVDGSAPGAASPRYTGPLRLPLPAQIRAVALIDGHAVREDDRRTFTAALLRTRTDEHLPMCRGALTLRLEDDTTVDGRRAFFTIDIFDPCWSWPAAPLRGIDAIEVRAGRLPYFFQLANDESGRRFIPAQSAHGELLVRDGCDGPLLASVPLPAAPERDGFVTLRAPLSRAVDRADLCVRFTGDTRPAMWALDQVRLLPR